MSSASMGRRKRVITGLVAGAGAATLLLSACTSPGGSDTGGDAATEFSFLSQVESPFARDELSRLAENECSAENEALPLVNETMPQADVVTRISLLASQDELPVMFPAPTAQIKPGGDLADGGLIVDYEEVLTELGVIDNILPGAISAIKNSYGGRMSSIPFQYNIEGIFYNKEIFAANGLEIPETIDELTAAAETLSGAGVQPFSVAGQDGWPATRWISSYLFRDLGADAIQKVVDGEASFNDPEYLPAVELIAEYGANGWFGPGVGSIDYDTATTQFLTGQSAMMYMGTWLLSNINNPELNTVGAENIGFMPFPAVEGGAGSIDQFPANAGTGIAMSQKLYGPKVGDWLSCITENFGSGILESQGAISGFKINTPVDDVPALTAEIQGLMADSTESLLWFETLFDEKTGDFAQFNVAQVLTGSMSPADYLAGVQSSLDQR